MKKNYLKKAGEYFAGSAVDKIIALILLPVFTHTMIPVDYAVYTNVLIFISFAIILYTLGFEQAIFSYFYTEKTPDYAYRIIGTMLITVAVIGATFSGVIIINRRFLSSLLLRNVAYSQLFIYAAIILVSNALFSIVQSIANIMERSRGYVILGLIKNVSFFIGIMVLYICQVITLDYVLRLLAVTAAISAVIAIFYIGRVEHELRKKATHAIVFDRKLLQGLLRFGLIMIPGVFAMIILSLSDRYMLTYLSPNGLSDVGIYAIGYKIGMVIGFLNGLVSLLYFPVAMKIKSDPFAKKSYRLMFKVYALFAGIISMWVILFSREIFAIFIDVSYYAGIPIVFFGVVSKFLQGIFNLENLGFYVKKRSGNIAGTVIIGALCNIGLNFLLIPRWGMNGAGIASVLSYAIIVAINFIFAERYYHVGYSLRPVLGALVGCGGAVICMNAIPLTFWGTFGKVIGMAAISIILFQWIIYREHGKQWIDEISRGVMK